MPGTGSSGPVSRRRQPDRHAGAAETRMPRQATSPDRSERSPAAGVPIRRSILPPAAMLLPAAILVLGCAGTRLAAPIAPPAAGSDALTGREQQAAAARYREACDAGLPLGCYNLGIVEATGLGLPRDGEAAAAHFAKACDAGDVPACGELGALLAAGLRQAGPRARTRRRPARRCRRRRGRLSPRLPAARPLELLPPGRSLRAGPRRRQGPGKRPRPLRPGL
jgi:hypothetical protein